MIALHGPAVRERTLPVDAMLRIVYESVLPTSVPVVPRQEKGCPRIYSGGAVRLGRFDFKANATSRYFPRRVPTNPSAAGFTGRIDLRH